MLDFRHETRDTECEIFLIFLSLLSRVFYLLSDNLQSYKKKMKVAIKLRTEN